MDARLPLNPNLGFYRKSAKELKRAVAAQDEGAVARLVRSHPRYRGRQVVDLQGADVSLGDAQLVIAREHGFSTWAEFKAAIEKAAANPESSASDRLVAAIKGADHNTVRDLLTQDRSLAAASDSQGVLPLVEACERGFLEIVRLLLDAGADPREPQALLSAAHSGPTKRAPALDVVELLIERGAPNDIFTHAALGRVDDIRRELPNVDINARGPAGSPALSLAAGNGHVEAVRVLLEAGAQPSAGLWAYVFLHIWGASYREIATMLVDRGAPCSFHEACLLSHLPTVRRLLAADPDLKDRRGGPDGLLPMERAIFSGDVELARVLVEAGAADPTGQGRALVEAESQQGKTFAGALYRNCSFQNANFQDCNLRNVVLHDVDLSGARIGMVNLTGVRIDAAWIDGLTIYGIEVQPLLVQERKRREAEKKKAK
jgi:ankyrin repeat protein